LYHLEHPQSRNRSLGFDICATDQCQVYRGVLVEQGAFGDAWIRAVGETRGQVLRYRGDVIQAFYHSTSPGRTKTSFPGGSPLPYLRSVAGQDDASPVSRWSVTIPFADLGPVLDAAGEWRGGAVTGVSMSGETVRVSGASSTSMSKTTFRNSLNSQAACVYPTRYPSLSASGKSKLPQTVPSIDFSLSTSGSSVVLTGRGWGHGVGMSQYGAKSLAEQGRTFADIVAYFYNGLRPEQVQEPGVIRVLAIEDASLVRIGVEGSATVTTSSGSTLAPGDQFEVRSGRILDVRRGIGPSSMPVLKVEVSTPDPVEITEGDALTFAYALSGAAKVTLMLMRDGAEVIRSSEISQTSGANAIVMSLSATATPTPSPVPVTTVGTATPTPVVVPTTAEPGAYELVLEAFDGLDRVRTTPVALTIAKRPSPKAAPPAPPSRKFPLPLAIAAGLVVVAGAFLVVRRARRPAA
jgi:SpoIID/LytB domain protein